MVTTFSLVYNEKRVLSVTGYVLCNYEAQPLFWYYKNMLEEIDTVIELHQEGKLDRILRIRLIYLTAFVVIFGAIGLYNLIVHELDLEDIVFTIIISFMCGMFIFSRMNTIGWDEKKEIMQVNRLDFVGFVILVLYVLSRVYTNWILGHFSHNTVIVSSMAVASIFGVMFGRLIATLVTVHKIHTERNKKGEA